MEDFPQHSYRSTPDGDAELLRLADKYSGVIRHSWHYEEWFILEFFEGLDDGFYLDVGACDWISGSNSIGLEKEYNWSGIAIDAQASYRDGYLKNRPNATFFTFFISDKSDSTEVLNIARIGPQSTAKDSASSEFVDSVEVPTITLNDLLERENVEKVDFVNLDIEGFEIQALQGFDLSKYQPKLLCIETIGDNAPIVEEMLLKHGYKPIQPWSESDTHNVYYSPGGKKSWRDI